MAQYDLTSKMIPYLDRHLVFPLLQFLSLKELYVESDLLQAKYDLLSKTNMVDFTKELYKQIHQVENDPEQFLEQREKVLDTLNDLQDQAIKVMEVIENPEVIGSLRQDKFHNLQFLKDNYNFTDEMIVTLYRYGKFQYECGNYGGSSDMLYHFRVLSTDNDLNLSALWGKLASEILQGNWEAAYEDLQKLREAIDMKAFADPLQQLQQRTWLIHWSLFVFFNHPKGRDGIVDMFFLTHYLNTIQTSCPWILRYLAAAVVTNKRRKNNLRELVKVIEKEAYMYRDPITDFLLAIYVDFDFEAAQQKLQECEQVLVNDFFLLSTLDDFLENARCFVAEAYCRIHQRINIAELSSLVNLGTEEGEKWIANLIRDTRMDAKIDFQENTVVMNPNLTSLYQQVIEKTKGISFRSQIKFI
ncbi:eIF3 subunit 6 N terminal domain-containing protein [Dimargaris cristalligena]|uniref:Eukaryotic translation initiation factor 3 subunit E n=1 Tax=Dimargaris cristalligena TaxID=215637 RepID=A0A4P9ZSP0_9FUNG|nr:eIF3 subunit 6 N terminal domain-containing protein [Dimargaris cristalligena]|eukprot:RKP36425.1 eIF3 subunit 6 N terminal domain-containing protein [Dimargaris cristalligena]